VAFWSRQRVESQQAAEKLVEPYLAEHIEQNAYALGVAPEYAITTPDGGGAKRTAAVGEHITIPPGQRLVVEYVSISGIANSLSGPIQPSIILESSLTGGLNANYYLQPGPTAVNIPGANQLYFAQPVKVYADSLTVAPAYAGFAPFTYTFNVALSGHLVPVP